MYEKCDVCEYVSCRYGYSVLNDVRERSACVCAHSHVREASVCEYVSCRCGGFRVLHDVRERDSVFVCAYNPV